MRQLTRLIRYVFPFLPQLLPGVCLLGASDFWKHSAWSC